AETEQPPIVRRVAQAFAARCRGQGGATAATPLQKVWGPRFPRPRKRAEAPDCRFSDDLSSEESLRGKRTPVAGRFGGDGVDGLSCLGKLRAHKVARNARFAAGRSARAAASGTYSS